MKNIINQKSLSTAIFPLELSQNQQELLSGEALRFLKEIHQEFNEERKQLLLNRADPGKLNMHLKFKDETSKIREADWQVGKCLDDLQDRTVEITGPVDRKMVINGLNSGANVYMADFEDSCSPTWENIIEGQINLYDAVRGNIDYVHPKTGKLYQLNEQIATLMVRPRGLHLEEKNVQIEGENVSASFFDFALFFFHNANYLVNNGRAPYFYLPKLEDHKEAALWNSVFVKAQDILGIPQGTIKATVLLETLPAAFQMDEILYELKEHSAGLNCGRWDYIFSYIKNMHAILASPLPDRSKITMESHFMKSYCQLLVQTCHKRGAFAMGGMAAQIPIKKDLEANEKAMQKVKDDKYREVLAGHDGTWVAHPGLVKLAHDCFKEHMSGNNQINKVINGELNITTQDLLLPPEGSVTEEGIILNIDVGIRYIVAWLLGNGCVPIYNLMEDAATAEISRTQLWHWYHRRTILEDGRVFNHELFDLLELKAIKRIQEDISEEVYLKYGYDKAARIMKTFIKNKELDNFLTNELYKQL
ncbi:MAG: malate synthase A [Flavobacteriales bacterium]|nr:MAG: malate synthase A [Flavobacteriales bacterium]